MGTIADLTTAIRIEMEATRVGWREYFKNKAQMMRLAPEKLRAAKAEIEHDAAEMVDRNEEALDEWFFEQTSGATNSNDIGDYAGLNWLYTTQEGGTFLQSAAGLEWLRGAGGIK